MFRLIERPEFTHEVKVMVPTDGGHREETFRARFRVLPDDEAEIFRLDTPEGTKDFLRKVVVGFEDVVDESDVPIAMSDQLRDAMLGQVYVRSALIRTYADAVTRARAGN